MATTVGGSVAGAPASSCGRNVADEVPFQDFCNLLERINGTSGTERKKRILTNFLDRWRESHAKLHPTDAATTTDTFFSAMRLLLPHWDRDRPPYGMKEVTLAKYYIEVLNIAKESSDAQKLLHYRAPRAAKEAAGDFASVAYFVLRNRCPEKGSLTVAQVNAYLDELAVSNTKSKSDVKKALQLLIRNTSALEQKWLIRIILKDLKTGLSENSVFTVYHPDAIDLFSVCSSLEKVCSDLRDPHTHLNETSICYFTPFRPMLGERAEIHNVMKQMENGPFYIETKFDGDRMQLHKQGNQYKYFSRSSKDYTQSFGQTPYEGSFTPRIHGAFNSKVTSCILDGEMVGWDPESESYVPKGDHVDVKTLGEDDNHSGVQQCFVVFDALMINSTNLANCPLQERAQQLSKVFEPVKGYMHLVDRKDGSTREDVVSALNDAIDRREEGILLKKPSSTYKPDKRKGSGWLKLKPEYVDSLSDQLDVVIIGGYFGVGHRAGMMSHFMCGVAVPPENPGETPSVFHSFCKVGTGYTLGELRDLGQKLKPYWRPFDTRHPPTSIQLAHGFKEKPDMWIEPSKSKIVQIRAAEIVVSEKYKCGCTLRFPRLEKVREDKEWHECMTLDELDQLKMAGSGRLAYQHLEDGDDVQPARKKRKVASSSRVLRPRGVAEQFRQTDVSDVQEVSKMFEGKEFCVINGPRGTSKEKMEKQIAEHGGTLVQNPTSNTFCVLVHTLIVRARNIIKTGVYDVVKSEFLKDCLTKGVRLSFLPSQMYSTSPSTASKFFQLFGKYGDSFTDDTDEETLREAMDKISEDECKYLVTPEAISDMEQRYFPHRSSQGLFRRYRFYLDKFLDPHTSIPDCTLEKTELDIRLYGGQISQQFDEAVTHVVFNERDLSRVSELRRLERRHVKKHHFVTQQWVVQSIEEEGLMNERLFEPKP